MTLVPSTTRRGAANGPFLLALIGFILALATAGYVVLRDPPWGRLSKYNFSTPEDAMRSQVRMMLNADVQARAEYSSQADKKGLKEKLDTLKVDHSDEHDGKKVLFIVYKKDGKEVKTVEWFEKDTDSGFWKPTYVSSFDIRDKNPKLAKEIDSWGNRGGMPGMPELD